MKRRHLTLAAGVAALAGIAVSADAPGIVFTDVKDRHATAKVGVGA